MRERLTEIIGELRSLDNRAPIIGSFIVRRNFVYGRYLVPFNLGVVEDDLEVPIRLFNSAQPYPDGDSLVPLTTGDAIASFLVQGDEKVVDSIENFWTFHAGSLLRPTVYFWEEEGATAKDSAVSTDAYYRYLESKNR